MTKAWTEAQKKMWEGWYELARAAPAAPFFKAEIVDQWRRMAIQSVEAWTAGAEPTAKNVTKHLFTAQEAMTHFLDLSTRTWQAMASRVEAGEDWQTVLTEYINQFRQQFMGSSDKLLRVSQDMNELWQLYLAELQKLAQPWLQSWQQAPGSLEKAAAGDGSALVELSKNYWSAYEHTFGHLLESPGLGYTRELNEKVINGFQAWQELHQANVEYQVLLTDAWLKAFERLQQALVSLAEKREAIQSLEKLVTLWNDVADAAFIEVFNSEKYIRAQGRLVNRTMTYRIRQREIAELFFKINDIPTRSEVDEVHRLNYQQRKDIKTLRKRLADISNSTAEREAALRTELDQTQQAMRKLELEVKALKKAFADISATASQNKREEGR
jgi:class III poly(R)-hydroxyalkanoic acid synthase PhaE subunit